MTLRNAIGGRCWLGIVLAGAVTILPSSREVSAGNDCDPKELVVNGSFEDPDLPGGHNNFTEIPGWTATLGTIEIQADGHWGQPFEGDQFVELDARENSIIQQLIPTVVGQSYLLEFAYSPRPDGKSAESNQIDVSWDGQILDSLEGLGNDQETEWTMSSFEVAANNDFSLLEFAAAGPSDSYGGYLDAVSVCRLATPDPDSPTGDFNEDFSIDSVDVNLLASEIADGTNRAEFNLNDDTLVNRADLGAFLGGDFIDGGNKPNGDANFDGVVSFADFLILSFNFGLKNRTWTEGDFDANGDIEFPDFLILSNNFGRLVANTASVPEPSSCFTMFLAVAIVSAGRRSRQK